MKHKIFIKESGRKEDVSDTKTVTVFPWKFAMLCWNKDNNLINNID